MKKSFSKKFIAPLLFLIIATILLMPFSGLQAIDVLGELKKAGHEAKFTPAEGTPTKDLNQIIGTIIKAILGFLGVVFLVLIIYGGFIWMTAEGNDEEIKKAKGIITNATIGLVIVLAAYAITFFVMSRLGAGTGYNI